jgi:hypothetical protein
MSAPNPVVTCPNCGDQHRSKRRSGLCAPCSTAKIEQLRLAHEKRALSPDKQHLKLLRESGGRFDCRAI